MGMDLGLESLHKDETTTSDIFDIADNIVITTDIQSVDLVAIENIIAVKNNIDMFGETPELKMLIGEDVLNHIKHYDISNEGLGEAIGKIFKWIADMFKRIFGISDASEKQAKQKLEELKRLSIENVEINKFVNIAAAEQVRTVLQTYSKKLIADFKIEEKEDVTDQAIAEIERTLKEKLSEIIGGKKVVKRDEGIKYLEAMTTLRRKVKADAEWFADAAHTVRMSIKNSGDNLDKYKSGIKAAQFITRTYATLISDLKVWVDFSQEEAGDGHKGIEDNDE